MTDNNGKKRKIRQPALTICGYVFMILGLVFGTIGGVFWVYLDELKGVAEEGAGDSMIVLPLVFSCIGLAFVVTSIVLLIVRACIHRKEARLLNGGYYILAKIVNVDMDYRVRINYRHPYYVECLYEDAMGVKHLFRSNSFMHYIEDCRGKEVRVYLDAEKRDSFKSYYVDIDSILQEVVIH